jgi:hypothetical protein
MSESWRDPHARHSALMAHSAICNAIVNRQEDAAAKAMLDHLEDSKERLASVLVLPVSRHVPQGQADPLGQGDLSAHMGPSGQADPSGQTGQVRG